MNNRVIPPIYECESLLPPTLQSFSNFGFSLCCNSNLLVVGTPGYKEARDINGCLFIYKVGVPHQLQQQVLVPTFTVLGELVTLSKNGYRIATTCKSTTNAYKIVILRKKEDWFIEGVIDVDYKPSSISLSSNSLLLAVGFSNQNEVQIYKLFSTKWKLLTTIPSTINDFGRTVLFDDERLYISGDENILIYKINNNTFELSATLFLKGCKRFGQTIAISPDKRRIAVGAPLSSFKGTIESGTVYVFQNNTQNNTQYDTQYVYTYTNLGVGWGVGWLDDKLIIGQPNKSYNMRNVGCLRIIDVSRKHEFDVIPNKKQKDMYFGWRLVSNNKFVYVGQPFWDEDTIYNVGRVSIFKKREM